MPTEKGRGLSGIAGFLSYARIDDQHSGGRISRLRERLELAIRSFSGLRDFCIFQDVKDIGWGVDWKRRIEEALDGSYLLFPIITPSWFSSSQCLDEANAFLHRQTSAGRSDLVLPLYYLESRLMEGQFQIGATEEQIAMATSMKALNYLRWKDDLRYLDEQDGAYQRFIDELARQANNTLHDSEAAYLASTSNLVDRVSEKMSGIEGIDQITHSSNESVDGGMAPVIDWDRVYRDILQGTLRANNSETSTPREFRP